MGVTSRTSVENAIRLMIIGAHKSGTSTLKYHVAGHPNIHMHRTPEFPYFVNDARHRLGYPTAFSEHWGPAGAGRTVVAAKSATVLHTHSSFERLASHNPDMHLAIVLRNPVDRAYSAYWFARRKSFENLESFEEAITASTDRFGGDPVKLRNCAYLEAGLYHDHLQELRKYFPRRQMHVFLIEDLMEDPAAVCTEIFAAVDLPAIELTRPEARANPAATARSTRVSRFLGAPSPLKRVLRSVLGRKTALRMRERVARLNERRFSPPPMDPAVRERLLGYYAGPIDRLSRYLERDLTAWT